MFAKRKRLVSGIQREDVALSQYQLGLLCYTNVFEPTFLLRLISVPRISRECN